MFFLVMVLCLPLTLAADLMVYTAPGFEVDGLDVNILEPNMFHSDDYISSGEIGENVIVLLDSSNRVLAQAGQEEGLTVLPFSKGMAQVAVYNKYAFEAGGTEATPVYTQDISFCDNDGVCEPCNGPGCELAENYLTCPDCASGSPDRFCDLKKDIICDPDCNGIEIDCIGCEPACIFEGADCGSVGGILCDPADDCIGGYFAMGLKDQDRIIDNCCISGFCGSLAEYIETKRQIEFYPENYEAPEFEPPTTDCPGRGGNLCDWNEECDGEWDIYIPSDPAESVNEDGLCCIGSCRTPEEDRELPPAYVLDQRETDVMPTPQEVAEALKGLPPADQLPVYIDEEELMIEKDVDQYLDPDSYNFSEEDIAAGDFPHEMMRITPEDEEPEVMPDVSTGPITEVIGFAQEQAGKVGIAQVAVLIIVLGLLIAGLVGIFKAVARSKVPIALGPDLQSEIDDLVAQGNDYKKVESMLVQKGHDRSHVDEEIRKNYQMRLAQQKEAKAKLK